MAYQWATWLADVLRDAGCTVVEEDGWKTRGRPGGSWTPRGVMMHHDASAKGETSNGVDVIRDGRPGLEGPLAQLWLDYDGRWHVVAAGRANHAGEGQFGDIPRDDGNTFCIGIETDHTSNEQWTAGQRSAALAGVAALCDRLGIRTERGLDEWFCAHKEYAPPRKIDPDPLDMQYAREQLLAYDGQGVLGMTEVEVYSNSTPQNFHGDGTFKTVVLDDDGALSLLVGPVAAYVATAGLTIKPGGSNPVQVGDVVQARYAQVIDYEGSKDTEVATHYPIHEIPVTSGDTFGNLVWANRLEDSDEPDSKSKLRLMICPPSGKTLSVSRVAARALH